MESYRLEERATPELIDQQRAMLTAERHLCELLDAMPDNVMLLNEHRQILFANRSLERFCAEQGIYGLIGMRPGEALSCHTALTSELGCGTGEACNICGAFESILAALRGNQASFECQILRQTPRGPDALDLRIWGSPLRWNPGQFIMVVAADISHGKRRKVLERLFFHDILNTAGTINQIAEMLMHGILDFDKAKNDLWQASQMLVREIRGQSELFAAENDELQVEFGLVLVRELLESVAGLYRNNEVGLGRRIVIREQNPGLLLLSDGALLTRVLGNLLKNALEASHTGETVTLGCRREETDIVLWCHNEGVLTRDVQMQIFRRSFSTKGIGRGVGTYSIKLLSEKYLQGRVELVSSAASGTTFTLTFPIAPKCGAATLI
jgi:signal transduction histidine kinase